MIALSTKSHTLLSLVLPLRKQDNRSNGNLIMFWYSIQGQIVVIHNSARWILVVPHNGVLECIGVK